jgi:hypothetical protein
MRHGLPQAESDGDGERARSQESELTGDVSHNFLVRSVKKEVATHAQNTL